MLASGLAAFQSATQQVDQNLLNLPVALRSPGPVAKKAAEWMQRSPDSWYRDESIPTEGLPPPPELPQAGELAKDAFVGRPEAGDTTATQHAKGVARAVAGEIVGMGASPANAALMLATSGIGRAFPIAEKAAGLYFGSQMVIGSYERGEHAYEIYRDEGWSPAASEAAAEAAILGGLVVAPMVSKGVSARNRGRYIRELGLTAEEAATLSNAELRRLRDQAKGLEPRKDIPEDLGPDEAPGAEPTGPTTPTPRGGPPGAPGEPFGPREPYFAPRATPLTRLEAGLRTRELLDEYAALEREGTPEAKARQRELQAEAQERAPLLEGPHRDVVAELKQVDQSKLPQDLQAAVRQNAEIVQDYYEGRGGFPREVLAAERALADLVDRLAQAPPKQGAVGQMGQDVVTEILRALDLDIQKATDAGDVSRLTALTKQRNSLAESQREVNKGPVEPVGLMDPIGQAMSDAQLVNLRGRLKMAQAETADPLQRNRLENVIQSIDAQLKQPGRLYGGGVPESRPAPGKTPTDIAVEKRQAEERARDEKRAKLEELLASVTEEPGEAPGAPARPTPPPPPPPAPAPAAAAEGTPAKRGPATAVLERETPEQAKLRELLEGPPVEPTVEGPPAAAKAPAPEPPPPAKLKPSKPQAAPGRPVRSDIGRGKGGKGWIVRRYDRDDQVVEEEGAETKKEAQAIRKVWAKEEGRQRRLERSTTLDPAETRLVLTSPQQLRGTDTLDMALEAYADGNAKNSRILRALRAARQLGQEIDPGWLELFPLLSEIETTGKRTPIRKGELDPNLTPEQRAEFVTGEAIEGAEAVETFFVSGQSRPKDIAAAAQMERPFGVDVGELSKAGVDAVAAAVGRMGSSVFVDSGAFSLFKKGLKAPEGAPSAEPLDFDDILDRYEELLGRTRDLADPEENVWGNFNLVMPDVVGDQAATIEALKQNAARVRDFVGRPNVNIIVPLQKGDLSLADMYAVLSAQVLGTHDFTVGLPGNAAAVTPEEVGEFVKKTYKAGLRIHFLGVGPGARLDSLVEAVRKNGPSDPAKRIPVTADANLVRALLTPGVGRAAAQDAALAAPPGTVEAGVPPLEEPGVRDLPEALQALDPGERAQRIALAETAIRSGADTPGKLAEWFAERNLDPMYQAEAEWHANQPRRVARALLIPMTKDGEPEREVAPTPGAAPIIPDEPAPGRTRWVGRGAHGNARVVFPDRLHADLYKLGGRPYEGMADDAQRIARAWGLEDTGPGGIGAVAGAYRDAISAAVRALPKQAGEEYVAPAASLVPRETGATPLPIEEEIAQVEAERRARIPESQRLAEDATLPVDEVRGIKNLRARISGLMDIATAKRRAAISKIEADLRDAYGLKGLDDQGPIVALVENLKARFLDQELDGALIAEVAGRLREEPRDVSRGEAESLLRSAGIPVGDVDLGALFKAEIAREKREIEGRDLASMQPGKITVTAGRQGGQGMASRISSADLARAMEDIIAPAKTPAVEPKTPQGQIDALIAANVELVRRGQVSDSAKALVRLEADVRRRKEDLKSKRTKGRKAKRELEEKELELEGATGAFLKFTPGPQAAVNKMHRLIRQIARDKVVAPRAVADGKFLSIVQQTIYSAVDQLDLDPQELELAVEKNKAEIAVPEEVILAELERDAAIFLEMDRQGELEEVQLFNVVTKAWDRNKKVKIRWRFHFGEIPGLGVKTIKRAVEGGPGTPGHDKIVAYRTRKNLEGRALEEALAEMVPDNFMDDEAHAALEPIALALEEDLQDQPEPSDTRPMLTGPNEGQHPDATESHLLKTFIWGLKKPGTQESFNTQEVVDAIKDGKGQDYLRIVHAYRDAVAAEGGAVDDVPFDVPEGAADPDEAHIEQARRGYSTAKSYVEQKYAWAVPIKLTFADGSVHYDAIKGLNPGHALYLARDNWPSAVRVEVDEFDLAGSTVGMGRPMGGRYGPRPVRATKKQMGLFERPRRKPAVPDGMREAARQLESELSGKPPIKVVDKEGQTLVPGFIEATQATPQMTEGKLPGGMFTPEADAIRRREGPAPAAPTQPSLPIDTPATPRYSPKHDEPVPTDGPGREHLFDQPASRGGRGPEGDRRVPGARPGESPGYGVPGDSAAPGVPAPAGEAAPRKGIFNLLTIRPEASLAKAPDYRLIPDDLKPHLFVEQQLGAAKAIEAMDKGEGFLLADGTGAGKTRQILAVAARYARQGDPVLILAPAEVLKAKRIKGRYEISGSYVDDGAAMGVGVKFLPASSRGEDLEPGTVYISSYHDFASQLITDKTILILDEAHKIKNSSFSAVGMAGKRHTDKAKAALFATATTGDKPDHMLYLERVGIMEGKTVKKFMSDLGMVSFMQKTRTKDGVVKRLVWNYGSSKVKTYKLLEKLFERLTRSGNMIRREIDMNGLDIQFRDIELGQETRDKMERLAQAPFANRAVTLQHQRRQQEPDKLGIAQGIIQEELKQGRSVVLFASRVNRSEAAYETKIRDQSGEVVNIVRTVVEESEGTLKTLRLWLRDQGIPYAEVHGAAEGPAVSEMGRFQAGEARVMIATPEAGGTGINLDDRSGELPRTMIVLTAPFDSISNVQMAGRIHRATTMSKGRIIYLFSEQDVDDWNKSIIATKMKMLGAQVSGNVSLLDPEMMTEFGDPDQPNPGEDQKKQGLPNYYIKDQLKAVIRRADQAVVSIKQFKFLRRRLQKIGAIFEERHEDHGKYGDFRIYTLEGELIEGRLTPPEELEVAPFQKNGRATWKSANSDGLVGQPKKRYGTDAAIGVETLVETVDEFKSWRGFHTKHEKTLASLFGADAPLFQSLLGITSQAATVRTNVALAVKAYQQMRLGLPFTGYLEGVKRNLNRLRNGDDIRGQKIRPYTRAGHGFDEIAVDRHIARLVLGRENLSKGTSPNTEQVKFITALLRQAAEELGWTGDEVASAAWAAQQIRGDEIPEDEVVTYDEVLRQHATAIRRFRSYFGDIEGQRGSIPPALSALAAGEPDPFDQIIANLHGDATATGISEIGLDWVERVVGPPGQLKPFRVGTGVELEQLEDDPNAKWIGGTVREAFFEKGGFDLDGMPVTYIEDLGLIGQLLRNPAFETSYIFPVKNERIIATWAETVQLPQAAPGTTRGKNLNRWKAQIEAKLRAAGADGFYFMHNHPSGNPTVSSMDMSLTGQLIYLFPTLFRGHVVIDHGTFSVMNPFDPDPEVRRGLNDLAEMAQIQHGQYMGTLEKREWTIPSAQALVGKLGKKIQRLVPSIQELPDPFLKTEIDTADYYSEKGRIHAPSALQKQAPELVSRAMKVQAGQLPMIVFSMQGRVKQTAVVPIDHITHPKLMASWIIDWARAIGADHAFAIIPNDIENARGQSGLGLSVHNAVRRLINSGHLSDAVIQGRSEGSGRGGGIPFETVVDFPEQAFVRQQSGEYGATPPGEGRRRGPRVAGGAGGSGRKPPARPAATGGEQEDRPKGPFNWPDSHGPGTTSWDRRVAYARARLRARMGEAAMGLDPRAFWDAVILGADSFGRGLRSFAQWLSGMGGTVKDGGLLRRVWEYLQGILRPQYRETTRRAGVKPFPIEGGPAGKRKVIRPIPEPTKKDAATMLDWLERMMTPDPGTGKPPEFNRKGERTGLSTNINRISNEQGIREFITTASHALESRFGKARSYRSWTEAKRLALELGWTESDFIRALKEKGALTDYEIVAGRQLRQEASLDFIQKHGAFKDAQKALAEAKSEPETAARQQTALELEREMNAALQKAIGIQYATVAAGSEAGRALAAHRMWIESLTPAERFLRQMMRGKKPGDKLLDELSDAVMRKDMAAVRRIHGKINKTTVLDRILEFWINSILSGPATQAANITGNLTHEALLRTPERGLASVLDRGTRQSIERFLTGQAAPQERMPGEMLVAARALAKYRMGFMSALKLARTAAWSEEIGFSVKGEYRPPAIGGRFGKLVRTPGRMMEALDVGAKYAAASAERAVQVWRSSMLEAQREGGWTRERVTERAAELDSALDKYMELEVRRQIDPRELTKEDYSWLARNRELGKIKKAMEKAADVSTFRDETTQFSKYLQLLRAKYKALTFVIPFIRTPERILAAGLKRTPIGLADTIRGIRAGKLKGGEASDRLAQGIIGSLASAGIYMLAKDGLITGGGPVDWDERRNWLATGKKPYAIKIGNTWVSMQRIEPIATSLGIAADLAEATDEKVSGDMMDKLWYSVTNNVFDKTYISGMVSAAEAVGDPDRYGARFFKRTLGAFVPNLLASAARAIDPTIRQTDDIGSTLMARVPWFSQSLPPKLTGLGEPINRGEDPFSRFASPFRYSVEAGPEANLERLFLETGYSPGAPPKSISIPGTQGRKVMLTQEERELYASYAERATRFARALTANSDWEGLDVYAKTELLKRIYRFSHDAARREMHRMVMRRIAGGDYELKVRR